MTHILFMICICDICDICDTAAHRGCLQSGVYSYKFAVDERYETAVLLCKLLTLNGSLAAGVITGCDSIDLL